MGVCSDSMKENDRHQELTSLLAYHEIAPREGVHTARRLWKLQNAYREYGYWWMPESITVLYNGSRRWGSLDPGRGA